MSKIEVNTVEPQCGTTLTLGASGDTVTLGSGASQSGFGREGSVDWQTSIKTTNFTAVSGEGYFVDTTSGQITVNLPASPSAGAIVSVKDYANTADTNKITINRNGSNLDGSSSNALITNEGGAATFVVTHNSTLSEDQTLDSGVLAGPVTITGTQTVTGTLVII